ncbi:membrane protein [Salinimicrobium terrae]|uniref:membrane protein n=1 Tax=Salinimicrobium terrae TaxID=470866 RepID=UPI00040CAB5F|nr:membrane protein [Salinimicrobium terrae]
MESVANEGKAAAIWAYLTIIGTIIAYFLNNDSKNPFASFHIRQGLGIHITFYLLGMIVSWFNSWLISAPFYIFIVVLVGYGLIGAIQGERNEVPILGKQFQKWFSTIN